MKRVYHDERDYTIVVVVTHEIDTDVSAPAEVVIRQHSRLIGPGALSLEGQSQIMLKDTKP